MKLTLFGKDRVLIEGDAYETIEHARRPPAYPMIRKENLVHYEKTLRAENTDFTGGSYDSLFITPDMAAFIAAKEKLKNSNLSKRLSSKFTNINKRRRTLNEHDGEWDIARQWEIQPFFNAKRQETPNRIIDIECHLNVSWMVEAKHIAEYGCMVWAINDIIESCGISTNIVLVTESIGTDTGRRINVRTKVVLKKAGEYINPTNIARCLTPNYLRRILFSWYIVGCDFGDATASEGLGRPCSIDDIVKFDKGKLLISSETIRNPSDKQVQEEIVKAILGENK